jgi:ubiquinone/menaquinone biosynthesis C-methylase UbiE
MSNKKKTQLKEIDNEIKDKFNSSIYPPEKIILKLSNTHEYFNNLMNFKVSLITRFCKDKTVLDLCCATGEFLFEINNLIKKGFGLDLSERYIEKANKTKIERNLQKMEFNVGNARKLKFENDTFDLIFCYSSLYLIPNVEIVIKEISRVLKTQGVAILDFGNYFSLNTIVCKAHTEIAKPYHLRIKQMKFMLKQAGFIIIDSYAFQILPLWGGKPRWLKPLLHPIWKNLLEKQIGGKMIDEWICNSPIFRAFAFRHIFVCKKINNP